MFRYLVSSGLFWVKCNEDFNERKIREGEQDDKLLNWLNIENAHFTHCRKLQQLVMEFYFLLLTTSTEFKMLMLRFFSST